MTEKQQRMLKFVRDYFAANGRGPTHRLIGEAMGIKSKSGVHRQLRALTDYGFLKRMKDGAGNYVPAETSGFDLAAVSTRDLRAELQRRRDLESGSVSQ